jgi:hypothetical protein
MFEHACRHVGHSDIAGYMFEHACCHAARDPQNGAEKIADLINRKAIVVIAIRPTPVR